MLRQSKPSRTLLLYLMGFEIIVHVGFVRGKNGWAETGMSEKMKNLVVRERDVGMEGCCSGGKGGHDDIEGRTRPRGLNSSSTDLLCF